MTPCFPATLKLENRSCLVVGTTSLAAEKAQGLEHAGALVTRVARFDPEVARGAFLIIADVETAAASVIREFGEEHRIFVNVVDKPEFCSFTLPSVLNRGRLSIAVSTGGNSPAMAAWVRRSLEGLIGEEYTAVVEELGTARNSIRQAIPDYSARRDFYYALFASGILETARSRGTQGVRAFLRKKLKERIR